MIRAINSNDSFLQSRTTGSNTAPDSTPLLLLEDMQQASSKQEVTKTSLDDCCEIMQQLLQKLTSSNKAEITTVLRSLKDKVQGLSQQDVSLFHQKSETYFKTCLAHICYLKDPDILKDFLEIGGGAYMNIPIKITSPPINYKKIDRVNPLFYFVQHNEEQCVKVLLEKNADINLVIDKGIQIERNPLLMSFMCIANLSIPNLNTMKLLIYKGANPNPLFENGEDCLSYISYINDTDYSAFGQLSLETRCNVGLALIEAGASTKGLFELFIDPENEEDDELRQQLLVALKNRITSLEEAKIKLKTANNDNALQDVLNSLNTYDDSIGSFKKECFGINYEGYCIWMRFLTFEHNDLIDPLKNYYHQLMQKNLNKKLTTRLGFLTDAKDKLQEIINDWPQVPED